MTASSPFATSGPWNLVVPGYVAETLRWLEGFAHEALRLVPAKGEVLDVAAGPGSLTLPAARTARRVHAVDFASGMVRELRSRAAARGITNVHAQVADGQALPFPSGRFDAAYSMFGVIFFPNRARGLAEVTRVLRPGGRAVVSSWPPHERSPVFAALVAAMEAEAPRPGSEEEPTPLGTAAEVDAELRAAGFRTVEVHEHELVPGSMTPRELWMSFARGGAPAVLMRQQMGDEAFAQAAEGIVARMERTLGLGRREVRMTALLGVARR